MRPGFANLPHTQGSTTSDTVVAMPDPSSTLGASHLECTRCGRHFESERLHGTSTCCGMPLYARYDLETIRGRFRPEALKGRAPDLWRFAEVLPVRDPAFRLTLGEGATPLLDSPRLAAALGVERLWIKDEGQNPTASFKARSEEHTSELQSRENLVCRLL